jgi:flagellar assembly factor FliW
MPTLNIQGTTLHYQESDIITFSEGLIGMPQVRRMVLINREDVAPFLWLAAVEDDTAFLVIDPKVCVAGYEPILPDAVQQLTGDAPNESRLMLAIVTIAPDWTKSTINLRAPIVISPSTMQAAQIVLTDSPYKLNEPLPQAWAA